MRRARRLMTSLFAMALVVSVSAAWTPAASAAADDTLTVSGRGWGHGRGMGQWGAYGYARAGWSYQQILGHYYGGTSLAGDAGNPAMQVEISRLTGGDLIVQGRDLQAGLTSISGYGYLRVHRNGGQLEVSTAPGCAGPWSQAATVTSSSLEVRTAQPTSIDGLIRTCEAGVSYGYRGSLSLAAVGATTYVLNVVALDDYLRGVVAQEMPSSWGGTGGTQALLAQAVAARSYALSSGVRTSGARLCDNTACQVYQGAFKTAADGPAAALIALESARSDSAVSLTSSQVMRSGSGGIARTEFSSSTGGYTAGGTFPAVVDDGDAISENPHRSWSVSFSYTDAGAKLSVGTLVSLSVTQRNGLGADGGRVLTVQAVGSSGTRTLTGAQVRTALGLKSDWFTLSVSSAAARSLVRALYVDLLGREAEPDGLASWSSLVVQGASSAQLVGVLASSEEYRRLRVAQAYRQVLGREPDEAGLSGWVAAIRDGAMSVDDVARLFYESPEFYALAGNDDVRFVSRLYEAMLGREASASEVEFWRGNLATMGRGGVAFTVWFSMEAAQMRAGAYYAQFLGREPEWSGRVYWAQSMLAQGEGAVRVGIAGSTEYWNRAITRYP
jgi:SpoIID/LytB domain protein